MADFNYKLNRQGPKGNPGEKGDQGFSPKITVETNTAAEYKLRIVTESDSFVTDNLRGSAVSDQGGTYMRYNSVDGSMYAGTIDLATNLAAGAVYMASDTDIENENEFTVPNCAQVKDAIDAIEIPDISGLATKAELQAVENEIPDVSVFLTEADVSEVAITGSYNSLLNKPTLFSGNYNDLTNKPTIPSAANNGTLTLTSGGQTLGTFTADSSANVTINIPQSGGGGTPYTLPPATTSSLGGVIVGSGLSVAQDGTLSATTYTLPTASTSQLGGVKVDGITITIDSNGVISASSSGGGVSIDDTSTTSTTETWSCSKINTSITNSGTAILSTVASNYVGLTNQQTISGGKTFSGNFSVGGLFARTVDASNVAHMCVFSNKLLFGANNAMGYIQKSGNTIVISPAGDNTQVASQFRVPKLIIDAINNTVTFTDTSNVVHNLLDTGAEIDDTAASTTAVYSSSKTDSQISAAVANKVSSTDITNIVKITQTAYDALVSGGTVDANTFYIIIG